MRSQLLMLAAMTSLGWLPGCSGSSGRTESVTPPGDGAQPSLRPGDHAVGMPDELSPAGPIHFVDVAAEVGIVDIGLSFGVSAGDVDGDGHVDLFASGHYLEHPRLWRNRGDGTFEDLTSSVFETMPGGDMHAAQFADFDADGRDELLVLRGANAGVGVQSNSLYAWRDGLLRDVATPFGLDVGWMRGRTPLVVDYDGDALLDVFLTALTRDDGAGPPALFVQSPNASFVDVSDAVGFDLQSSSLFAVLGDLDGDRRLDVLFQAWPEQAFALGGSVIEPISDRIGLPHVANLNDVVIADFTGDGQNEIFYARGRHGSGFHLEDERTLEFRAIVFDDEHGVRLRQSVPGEIELRWGPWGELPDSDVHIGAAGANPIHNDIRLSPSDPAVHGIAPHRPGVDVGLYIGWDLVAQEWEFALSRGSWHELMLRVISATPVELARPIGFDPKLLQPRDRLLAFRGDRYVDIAPWAGVDAAMFSQSAVAVDFDNDMDLDLYVVVTDSTRNRANLLYENTGDGSFVTGTALGFEGADAGLGDAVISLDYDRDGRVDLCVVNGAFGGYYPLAEPPRWFADDGPVQLLRNVTQNDNHWLAVELVGVQSNRAAIGARVEVTTADGRTQVREHGGGMHRFSQNRGIHFGLGPHDVATRVAVWWPSGNVTVLEAVRADTSVRIVE